MTMSTETAIPTIERNIPAAALVAEDFSPGIEGIFLDEFRERDCVVETESNPIPDFLRGSYYLNGPARFARDGWGTPIR